MTTPNTFQLDPAHTTVGFAVKHMMFTTVRGRFAAVNGTLTLDLQNPARSTINVDIEAASIDTGVADRDAHLRSADFFDSESHPLITFRSKRIEGSMREAGDRFKVTGDLTIRGTSREVTLEGTFHGTANDPWGNRKAAAEVAAKIDRREFGLTWNQALETGGVLVGNEVRIEIEVQAQQAAAAA